MPKFTGWFNYQEQELHKALMGLYGHPEISLTWKQKNKIKNFHPYLIPIKNFKKTVCGLFIVDDKLLEIPLGLTHIEEGWEDQFYRLDSSGKLIEEDPTHTRLYLPISESNYSFSIRSKNKQRYNACKIIGTNEPIPFLFITQGKNKKIASSIYIKNQKIARINLQNLDQKVLKTLTQDLRDGGTRYWFMVAKDKPEIDLENDDFLPPLLEYPMKGPIEESIFHDPRKIISYLDNNIIGQERAKKAAAVVISNLMQRKELDDESIPKECLLFIGPTGSGKTLIWEEIAKIANLPFATFNFNGKSAEGYVGHRPSDVFKDIAKQTEDDAPYAIIFLDEIDKTAHTTGFTADYGPKQQQEMMGWLGDNGTKVLVKADDGERMINTKNILFVLAGAFHDTQRGSGLEDIIDRRIGGKKTIGFKVQTQEEIENEKPLLRQVQPEDLISYGLKQEFVGRITSLATLDWLTVDDKVRILKEAGNSVLQGYEKIFKNRGYELKMDHGINRLMANKCPMETGARGLKNVCSEMFRDVLYDPEKYANDKVIHITTRVAQTLLDIPK